MGEFITTGCSFDCGGNCLLKVYVENGKITRIATDDMPDTLSTPQLRPCARGLAQVQRVYARDRLRYPMRRVGERGAGQFERISWNEALDTVASELARIKETYGPQAVFNLYGGGNSDSCLHNTLIVPMRFFELFGGYTGASAIISIQSVVYASMRTFGTVMPDSDRENLLQSRLIIMWGCNPAITLKGTNTNWYLAQAKEKGARFIFVDPIFTESAAALADEWIPIKPGTDTAALIAMAHVIITENLYDRAFLDKYTFGFDKFQDYCLGLEDGVAKTPAWAEPITGVPGETIGRLAREYATTKPADLRAGWAPGRTAFGEQFNRAGITLAAMTGNIGVAGGGSSIWLSDPDAMNYFLEMMSLPIGLNPVGKAVPFFCWADAILKGIGGGYPSDIKMAYVVGSNILNQNGDINKGVQALKELEFVVVHEQFMTPTAKFADILLPVTTHFEREDIQFPHQCGRYFIYAPKVIEPMYECKSDLDIFAELAQRLGMEGFNDKSDQDWLSKSLEGYPIPDAAAFKKEGVYKFSGDSPRVALSDQINEPEKNPFPTRSGKIEIYSEGLAQKGKPELLPPIPKYIEAWEGPHHPLAEKYPLLMVTTHSCRRANSTLDNIPWLRDLERQAVWINTQDATDRGIKDGDEVRVFNEIGVLYIAAKVTERIMPRVVRIEEGAWYNPDKQGIDRAGSVNVLCKDTVSPGRAAATNAVLVQVEKDVQMGFYFDQGRCVGCYTCVVACKEWHGASSGSVSWRRVHTLEEGRYPEVFASHLSISCLHCSQPQCVSACPNDAISKRDRDGIVVVDRERCMPNCGLCLEACPYKAPQFGDDGEALMEKCDLCLDRLADGLKPICVEACPLRALDAGPMEELERKYGAERTAFGFPDPRDTKPCIVFNPRRKGEQAR